MDLHGRCAYPYEKGDQVGDTVVPFPREKIHDEEIRGRERSDRGGKEERSPSRDPLPEQEESKEVHRCGQPRGVPYALQCGTASCH